MPDSSLRRGETGRYSAQPWMEPPRGARPPLPEIPPRSYPSSPQAYRLRQQQHPIQQPHPDFPTSMQPFRGPSSSDVYLHDPHYLRSFQSEVPMMILHAPGPSRSFDLTDERKGLHPYPNKTPFHHHTSYSYHVPQYADSHHPPPSPSYSYYHKSQHPQEINFSSQKPTSLGLHPQPHPWSIPSMPPFSFAEDVPDVEYIVDLGPNDVLSGRGGATNSFKGNRAFRVLVKEYQKKYLQAKKRDKPAVAAIVVDIIRQKGGRFLQRCNSAKTPRPGLNHFHTPNSLNGEILWLDIGDDRAREKTCQALREGAPEIRRKTSVPKGKKSAIDNGSASSSFDDDEDVDDVEAEDDATQHRGSRSHPVSSSTEAKDTDATLSSPSTMEGTPKGRKSGDRYTPLVPGAPRLSILEEDSEDGWEGKRRRKDFDALTLHNHSYEHKDEDDRNDDEEESPIFIRPWSRLIPDRLSVPTIALDQLSVQDRDMYLRDFLPPCPRTERHQSRRQHESTMELSFANAVVIPGISSSVDNSFFEKTNSLGPFEDVQHVNCSSGSGTGINKPTKKEPALQAT